MAWETRSGGRYYYVSRRVGGRVRKIYFGNGLVAESAALLMEMRKAERAAASARRCDAADRLELAASCEELVRHVSRRWHDVTIATTTVQSPAGAVSKGVTGHGTPSTASAGASTTTDGQEPLSEPSGLTQVTFEAGSHGAATEAWIGVLAGDSEPLRQQVRQGLEQTRSRLAAAHPGPVAAMLIQGVLAGWLRVMHSDLEAARIAKLGQTPSIRLQRQHASANRQYARLLKDLERFRTLPENLPPG